MWEHTQTHARNIWTLITRRKGSKAFILYFEKKKNAVEEMAAVIEEEEEEEELENRSVAYFSLLL